MATVTRGGIARRNRLIQLHPKNESKRNRVRTLPRKNPKLLPEPDSARVQYAFSSMAAALAHGKNVTDAETAQLAIIQDLLKPKTTFTLRLDPTRSQLRVSTVRGRNDIRVAAAIPGEGPVGLAFKGRVVREDRLIAAPLGNAPFGCLVILSPRHAASDHLIAALGAQVTAAVQVAELNDDRSRRTKDLETAVAGLKSIERGREELLANVSHELKNPLTTIKAYLAMLDGERLGPIAERQRRAIGICEQNAERLHRMINDLLLISRLEAGEMALATRPFGLKALAEECIEESKSTATKSNIQFSLNGPEVFIRGDRIQLSKAVRNLLDNAVDSSPQNNTVEVEISSEHGVARLSVSDRGKALAPGILEHAFGSIHRSKADARSPRRDLGLPIAAKIIHLHGGRVAAAARASHGSTLSIYLPVFASAVTATDQTMEARPGGVLIVDDDNDCREVLKEVLEEEGFPVLAAPSAAAAKTLLEQVRPALVLLDLRLADDDGRSVLRHIRREKSLADVPVYIISGASDGPAIAAQKGGDRIDGFFEKPIQLAKLLTTVRAVVQPFPNATMTRTGEAPSA